MEFVFWQNFLSIHQSAFLRNLAEKHEVVLVVSEKVAGDRIKQGWDIPDFGNVRIIETDRDDDIREIVNIYIKSWHIFSGFDLTETTVSALKLAVSKNLQIGIMSEPFRWTGLKGKLRLLKFAIFNIRYSGKVRFILITGTQGIKWYRKAGFRKERLFHWGYFTEAAFPTLSSVQAESESGKPNVLFIGQLIGRKNIVELLLTIQKNTGFFNRFRIIGDGPLRQKVLKMIDSNESIEFMGNLGNDKVGEILQKSDLLVLPSKFDGWGAVVNESLQAGTPVVVSSNCGASDLVDGQIRGEKFYFSGRNTLETVLIKWLKRGKLTVTKRSDIAKWSERNISGISIAGYFLEVIDYVSGKIDRRPIAPWFDMK